jgi:hypothetical protein
VQAAGVQYEPSEDGKLRPARERRYRIGPLSRIFRPHVEIRQPLDYNQVDDWDIMENIWDFGFKELRAKPAEHPILLSEPPFSLQSQREKTVGRGYCGLLLHVSHGCHLVPASPHNPAQLEVMFEKFDAPAVFLAKSAVLAATSVGRSSAVVVDLGASCSRVTPVYDGYVLSSAFAIEGHGTLRGMGGEWGVGCLRFLSYSCFFRFTVAESMSMSEVGGQFLSRALAVSTSAEMLPHYAFKRSIAVDPRAPPASGPASAASSSAQHAASTSSEDAAMDGSSSGVGSAAGTAASTSSSSNSSSRPQREQVYLTGGGRWRVQRADIAGVTSSFHQAAVLDIVEDMKRALCVVDEVGFDPA